MSDSEEASIKIIGLTGKRGVGKTEVAKALQEHGYVDAHPFEGGKRMCVAYFVYLGIDPDTAERMVSGDLKDTPHPLLPGGVASRFLMERLGEWMGKKLGPPWTIGVELKRQKRMGSTKIVVSSVCYEENEVRNEGGMIAKVTRPGHKSPIGDKTDKAVDAIIPDMALVNDGDTAALHRKAHMLA